MLPCSRLRRGATYADAEAVYDDYRGAEGRDGCRCAVARLAFLLLLPLCFREAAMAAAGEA
jgi:hypothetical protein